MNRLLILDDEAPVYEAELRKRNLPDLDIVIAENELEAKPHLSETEIIFDDMEIDSERVLMPPGGFKRGFAELMSSYGLNAVAGSGGKIPL